VEDRRISFCRVLFTTASVDDAIGNAVEKKPCVERKTKKSAMMIRLLFSSPELLFFQK